MFTFLSMLIGIAAFGIFVAGLLALLRNPKKHQNRWFFAFALSLALWIPFNFFDSNVVQPGITDFVLKLDFITALFIGWAFVEFVEAYPVRYSPDMTRRPLVRGFIGLTGLIALAFIPLSFDNLLVSSSIKNGSLQVHYGPIFGAYVLLLCSYFFFGLGRLFYKRYKASKDEKGGLNYIFYGLLFAVSANLLTNLVFPIIVNQRSVVKELNTIGYLGLVGLALLIYLAITTQKLFDIRLIVARSLAYLFSLGSLGLIFVILTFGLTDLFLGSDTSASSARWVYTFLAVGVALLFPSLKKFFDSATNRFFYRDAYDPQSLLDELNKTLVDSSDINALMRNVAGIIEENLKCERVVFATYGKTDKGRFLDSHGTTSELKSWEYVRDVMNKTKHQIVSYDGLAADLGHLKRTMRLNNIAVVASLQPKHHDTELTEAYLNIGFKKSGNNYTDQDLRILEIIVNELVIAVQNSLRFEEIQHFNITLQTRIEEATHKLQRANEKLKQLDETKDDFISMASHQLRTPLTSVKGYISMILEGDTGKINDKQKEMLGQAFFSSQRMVFLIADLLNVSRLKTGKFVIVPNKTNLAEVVQQEIGQLKETAATRGLTLSYNKPKDFPDLMLDETKTRQIIMNFVDNAIYYTPDGGKVEVRLTETPTTVELRVIDNGLGVPKPDQPHLFTKFYRAGNARKARPDGTGLGLFMAKKVIIAQGGALIFESQEGKGSTFGFVFSKSKLAVPKDFVPGPHTPTEEAIASAKIKSPAEASKAVSR